MGRSGRDTENQNEECLGCARPRQLSRTGRPSVHDVFGDSPPDRRCARYGFRSRVFSWSLLLGQNCAHIQKVDRSTESVSVAQNHLEIWTRHQNPPLCDLPHCPDESQNRPYGNDRASSPKSLDDWGIEWITAEGPESGPLATVRDRWNWN